jgi:hypothetical protein
MAKKYIPDIRAGDSYQLEIKYNNGSDITGYKFWLTLKNKFTDDDSAAVLQTTTVAGSLPQDTPESGVCFFVISSEVTGTIPVGSYFYDLQARTQQGEITTLLPPISDYRSKVTVIPQVTNAKV